MRQDEARDPKKAAGAGSFDFSSSLSLSLRWAALVNDRVAEDSYSEVEIVITTHAETDAKAFWHLSPMKISKPTKSQLLFYLMPELPGLYIN